MQLRGLTLACLGVAALAGPASAQIIATSIPREGGGGTGGSEKKFALHLMVSPLSKWTYNAAVFYERNGVTGRISYNYRSPWVTNYRQATDGSQYTGVGVRAISRLDASLSYDVSKQMTISFDVTNLLAKPFENYNNYQPNRTYPVDVRYEGRYYGVGLRFRFGE